MDGAGKVEGLGADPDEMGCQALQFEQDDADDVSAGWHLGFQ